MIERVGKLRAIVAAAAAHAAHLLVGQVVDAPARQQDLAAGDAARRFQQAPRSSCKKL